jgi:dimethylargininase
MPLTAITRQVSPGINQCELSFHTREPIDVAKAIAQHDAYQRRLVELGLHVVTLPAEPELPDSVFVEDPAIVLDEVAVIMNMGAPSRRGEAATLAHALAPYRPLAYLRAPATMDGGDVLRVGRSLFVGLSRRSNHEGIKQLAKIVGPHGYNVQPVEMHDCLHLKSAVSYLGRDTLLLKRSWIDPAPFHRFRLLDVPEEEPGAANVLLVNHTLIMPASFPKTHGFLRQEGFDVRPIDVSELQKAEAGVTCCSLILGGTRVNVLK